MSPSPRYEDGILPSTTIYPKQRTIWYSLLLILTKTLKAFGLYLTYDLLKLIHIVPFLFIVKAGSAAGFLLLQRPACRGLHRAQLLRLIRHAFISCFLNLFWLFGLSLCGPLRTILVFEQSPQVIIAATAALFKSIGGPSKFRGAIFLLLAIFGILFFDHDDYDASDGESFHPEGQHNGIIKHTFYHFLTWSGLSDHKGGVVLLAVTLLASVVFHNQSKKLALDLGGAKRVNALSTALSTMMLLPWALFIHSTDEESVWIAFSNGLLPFTLVIITVFLLDYYVEAVASNKLEPMQVAKTGSLTIFAAGLLLSLVWSHPFVEALTTLTKYKEMITEDHLLSGGVIFSIILMIIATTTLTSSNKQSRGSIVGYSSAGQPLYSFPEEHTHKSGHSTFSVIRSGVRQVLEERDSRSIFYFLLLNLSFTFVELTYGAWTNSLGLISDGFHMLFDCSALVVGLYAAVMSRWKPTRTFSYGYDRVETLSGFINGLFLVIVSFFILLAAASRILHPPHINTDRLLVVSVLGLLVNLFGIAAFSHAHTHGGGGHSHSGHGHSHGADSHGHSHGDDKGNSNMRGVFLHVLADTLGSVGVIISTLLIQYFGWNIADPLCSIFIGVMIFISVIPLLSDTANVLLLRLPSELQSDISIALQKILSLEGVLSYRDQHFWRHSGSVLCGTLHIQISPSASEQHTVQQGASILKGIGIKNLTLQVEKEQYYHHLTALNTPSTLNSNLSYNSSIVRAI
ncbi:proton-coupled zinc antiporter SLC30A5-like [Watersipora subatra]|uniref:proton-coupled zinc antiporter SLC30A5-like n=1 Tax=Watersipora subatra TaxID=2589382 RepID=UPI00355B8E72